MRDIIEDIAPWFEAGERFALATVTRTWSSSPRPIGASMAVSAAGEVVGSVSGGCVEGALYEACLEVLQSGTPQRVTYGVSDDDAFEVGLTCGGIIELFICAVDAQSFPQFTDVRAAITGDKPIAVATMLTQGETLGRRLVFTPDENTGSLGDDALDASVLADARGLLEQGRTRTLMFGAHGERRMDDVAIFVESYAPAPRMIVFGAIDFAAAVARIGKFLGYYVVVCDARGVFATKKRFPDADEIVVSWPHKYLQSIEVNEHTALCVLTHDPKFDIPLLEIALRTNAGYIGAMGSRKTHNVRLEKLREIGMTDAEIGRLRSPIGLDLGARTPEETAVSIAAEIIADLWGGTKQSLTSISDRAIHIDSLASEKEARP